MVFNIVVEFIRTVQPRSFEVFGLKRQRFVLFIIWGEECNNLRQSSINAYSEESGWADRCHSDAWGRHVTSAGDYFTSLGQLFLEVETSLILFWIVGTAKENINYL